MSTHGYYFTIHGRDGDGWRLYIYQRVPDRYFPGHETITPYTTQALEFETLDELVAHVKARETSG